MLHMAHCVAFVSATTTKRLKHGEVSHLPLLTGAIPAPPACALWEKVDRSSCYCYRADALKAFGWSENMRKSTPLCAPYHLRTNAADFRFFSEGGTEMVGSLGTEMVLLAGRRRTLGRRMQEVLR